MASGDPQPPPAVDSRVLQLIERGELGNFLAQLVLAPSHSYLNDAAMAFLFGMNEAASLLCRTSMEAAMYTFLFVEPAIGSNDPTLPLLNPPEERMGFEDLYNRVCGVEVSGTKLLSEPERTGLLQIGKHGNTIAHVIERFHRSVLSVMASPGTVPDFPYPERGDVEKDLAAANAVLDKLRNRLAIRLQEQAKTFQKTSPAEGP